MPKILKVIVNRYAHLDHLGRPAAAVILDVPGAPAGRPRYVGATFKATAVDEQRSAIPNLNKPKQDSWLEYVDGPVYVLDGDHHRMCLRTNEMFAADRATWKLVFPGDKEFVPGEELLSRARTEAIEEWKREHDGEEPSFVAAEAALAKLKSLAAAPAAESTPSTDGAAAENG
jgi:hypothetical protein